MAQMLNQQANIYGLKEHCTDLFGEILKLLLVAAQIIENAVREN